MDTCSSILPRFNVELPRGKFVEFTSILKGESTWNFDIDSMWKFRRGFNFQNRHNIDEFATWIFLCRFDVESTEPLCSLFPLYISQHFLLWEPILCYSGIVLSRCNFNNIDVITDFGTIGTISFGNFCNNANK